jgi:hypothetical protein
MTAGCELAAFLRSAGPVRAPLRTCCLVALFDGGGSGQTLVEGRECRAAEPEPQPQPVEVAAP